MCQLGLVRHNIYCQNLGRKLTKPFGNLDCCFGLLQIRTSHHHFGAADVFGALDDILEVILVHLSAMVTTAEHGIAEVDANLERQQLRTEYGSKG